MHFSNDSENLSSLRTRGQGGLQWAKRASASLGLAEGGGFQAWAKLVGFEGDSGLSLRGQEALTLSQWSTGLGSSGGAILCQFSFHMPRGFPCNSLHQEASLCVHIILVRESRVGGHLSDVT